MTSPAVAKHVLHAASAEAHSEPGVAWRHRIRNSSIPRTKREPPAGREAAEWWMEPPSRPLRLAALQSEIPQHGPGAMDATVLGLNARLCGGTDTAGEGRLATYALADFL